MNVDEGKSAPLHVVVGVEGEPVAGAVLRRAGDLAKRLGARLDVVHVVDISDVAGVVPRELGAMPVPMDTPEERAAVARSREVLEAAVERELGDLGVDWVFHAGEGDPAQALADLAEKLDAYCIVVGTRGEGFRAYLDRLVRPSVSHALIRDRHRPVLIVPDPETG